MNDFLPSASLKSLAKGQLLGKYGTAVGAYALHMACVTAASFGAFFLIDTSSIIGTVIYYAAAFIISLLSGLFVCGEAYIYLKIACNQKASISDLFHGFQNMPNKILQVQAVLAAISLVCSLPNMLLPYFLNHPDNSLLFLLMTVLIIFTGIVNIILTLTFSQCYYLMLDFPQYSAKELLLMSKKVMTGSKGRLFYIQLSFLPLMLLSTCTCCLAFLLLGSYMQATQANFYLDLMKKRRG